jgi:hypothetical protein
MSGTAPYYAEAFLPLPGRCFRLVARDGEGGPAHCPESPRWRGSFQAKDSRRYIVEAYDGHRSGLEQARRITDTRPFR